jgi:hypothetical protein
LKFVPASVFLRFIEEIGLDDRALSEIFKVSRSDIENWKRYGIKSRSKVREFEDLTSLYRIAQDGDGAFSVEELKNMIELVAERPYVVIENLAGFSLPEISLKSVIKGDFSALMTAVMLTFFLRAKNIDIKWDDTFDNREFYR